MTVTVVLPTRDAAIALAEAIGQQPRYARDGVALPRCEHPKWRLGPGALKRHLRAVARRGVVPPCPCEARDRPSTRCPHVTWQAASVLGLPNGTVLVQAEAAAPEGRPEPRRPLSDAEREAVDEIWTLRDARAGEG